MLEVPGDFNYEVEPTPYGFSLSVTIEKPCIDIVEMASHLCPSVWEHFEIDQVHF